MQKPLSFGERDITNWDLDPPRLLYDFQGFDEGSQGIMSGIRAYFTRAGGGASSSSAPPGASSSDPSAGEAGPPLWSLRWERGI